MMNPFEQLTGAQLVNPFEQEKARRAVTAAKAKPAGRSVYEPLARKIAEEEGVDPELFTRLIQQESTWDPKAVSRAGAQGLGQVMPPTWRDLDKGRGGDPFDPETNLRYSAKYLADQVRKFGDPRKALAAYNAGPGAVQKHGGVPPYRETQDYVARIWDNWEGKTQVESGMPRAGSAAVRSPQAIIQRLGTVNPFEAEKARRAAQQPEVPQVTEKDRTGQTHLGAGFEGQWLGTKKIWNEAKVALGDALGDEGMMQEGFKRSKELEKEIADVNKGKSAQLEDVKDIGSGIDWFVYQVGGAFPSIVESVAAAGAGALVGSSVPGAGTVGGAVYGALFKQSAKKLLQEYGEQKAKKIMASKAGAAAALFLDGAVTGLGDIYGETMDEKGKGNLGIAVAGMLPYAAAESVVEMALLGRVLKGSSGANALTRYVKAITIGASAEAASEASQEALVISAGLLDGKEYDTAEVISRLGNAAASAAVAGGMVGAVSGRQGTVQSEPSTPATPTKPIEPETPDAAMARIRLEAEQAAQVMRERGMGEADIEAMRANYETALTVFDQEGLKELPEVATKLPDGYQEMYDKAKPGHSDQSGFTPRWKSTGYTDDSIFEDSLYNEAGVSLKDWLANPDSTSFVGLPSRAALEYDKTFGDSIQKQNASFIENGKPVIDEITAALSSVVQKYAPKMKVAVDISSYSAERLKSSLGSYHYDTRLKTAYINVHPKMLGDARSMQSIGVVAHEFGHALQWGMLKQADAKVKNAIVADYHAHLREFAGKTPKEWTDGAYEPTYAYSGANDPKSNPRYHYSFEEWFANQVARKIQGDHLDNLQSPVRQFIERVAKAFTEFYDKVRGTYRAMPAVEVWMEGLAARNALIREGIVLDNDGFLGSEAQAGAVVAGDKQPLYQGEISPATIPTNPDAVVAHAQDPANNPWESANPTAQIAEETKYDQQTDGVLKQLSSKLGSEQLAEHVKGMDMSWGKLMLSSMRWALSAPQIRQQFERYIPALAKWVNLNYEWSQTASQIIQPADAILNKWRKFNEHAGKQKDILAQFLLYATDFSFKNGIKLQRENADGTHNQRFLDELKKIEDKVGVKATEETLSLWEEIDKSLRDTIVEAKRALVYELANEFSTKTVKIDAETVLSVMDQGRTGADIVATI
ncbi:MAG: transglycosylase SLT domain-containing protein, partial [Candidatus Competibacteraceae bacterium]|nr:transglycosylase SLT domain-containing protein [Candidatus Competibacteraceae bacterium]